MKYNNRKTEVDNIRFDSQKEANFYVELKLLKRAHNDSDRVVDIELQPTYELQKSFKKNGKTHRAIKYVADFKVTYADGRVEIIDVKSEITKTLVYRIKKKLFEFKFPDLTIKEVI